MREVVRELAEVYPSEQYLMNLAALHGQLGDRQKQLALVEAMLDDGRITRAAYLKMLASLYLAENLPFKAANLLETAVADGRIEADVATLEQTSQAWYLAQELERAAAPLARAAAISARETESGELYLRLAGLHMDSYQWTEADQAAALALEAGGLKREGEAWLMRGMANAQLERYDDARVLFKRAQAFESTRAHADQWLVYVASEQKTKAVATGR
jgi:tetratricopeptide (TPR) repeat protein